jgi:tRNA modification GTPase
MIHDIDDTIVAIASPSGPALKGIVRISGPDSISIVSQIFKPDDLTQGLPTNRARCIKGKIAFGQFDQGIPVECYCWPDQRSYTRQIAVELHTIGSDPVLQAIERVMLTLGARIARPGEFTMRAFLAGRMDLAQAEAVMGVIDAHDTAELKFALEQLAGGLTTPLHQLRESLLQLLAHLEAGLDFVEEDIEFISSELMLIELAEIHQSLERLIEQIQSRNQAGQLPRVVLIGKPNAGKSSLFNALVDDQRAIVSSQAGTTRDFLTAKIQHDNVFFELVDSAGIDELAQLRNVAFKKGATANPLSVVDLAAEQTELQRRTAHVLIRCRAVDDAPDTPGSADRLNNNRDHVGSIDVVTKIDLAKTTPISECWIATSSVNGSGIDKLKEAIVEQLRITSPQLGQGGSISSRCLESLYDATSSIQRAICTVNDKLGDEVTAVEIRDALDSLGHIVGTVYTDDILDRIFSQFCIGK